MGKLKCKSSCHNNTKYSCIPFLVHKKIICSLFEILNCHGSDLIHLKLGVGIMQVEREIIFFKTNFGNETICFCKNQLQGMKMEVFEE
jgi:hypothetical protein